MTNWEKVFSTDKLYRAELVKSVLEDRGIGAVLVNKKESIYNFFGQIEVHVTHEEVLNALKIIKDEIKFKE
ncbi:MAG: putative signal transducing protein [Cytophagaceae bacterium]